MNDYIVAELLNSIDTVISAPIQQTHRIKYTTCDISENFIVFGASSGGLYIFNRHPCSFIKLIPSTEGAVSKLSISPDEKTIAVATSKGTLCLFNNDNNLSRNILIFNEHQDNIITAMKWHPNSNELYSGDNTGKISVVVTNFISKAVFQMPCATLMNLDSRIVQLDWGCQFLLVSTLTRSYLCDTDKEHYRQIGKKLREGEYGACFFGGKFEYVLPVDSKIKLGSFSIYDKEYFVSDGLEHLKIFCARPGARIWEVQLNGTVVRTHQFKEALTKRSNNIISLEENPNQRLNFKQSSTNHSNTNFTKLYILQNNFILTFQENGLYILDPQKVAVVFWTDLYTNIIEVKIVKEFIYLWTTNNQMHVLLFTTLEQFILRCLLKKMYLFCADFCILYQNQIKKLLPISRKLYLLSILEEKLLDYGDLYEEIKPLLLMIKDLSVDRQIAKKLSSGIFIVDNLANLSESDSNLTITTTTTTTTTTDDDVIKNPVDFENETDNKVKNKKFDLLLQEFELNKINSNYQTDLLNILFEDSLQNVTDTFRDFVRQYDQLDTLEPLEEITKWTYEKCLKFVETYKDKYDLNDIANNNYVKTAFLSLNSNFSNSCSCKFPLPKASLTKPIYIEIGRILLKNSWIQNNYLEICTEVPYMWKYILVLRENENITDLLPFILQIGNMNLFKYFENRFTYDLWNEIIKKFIVLKMGKCLNCDKNFGSTHITWNDLAKQMIKTIGAESTVCLLLQHAGNIEKSELDVNFYQLCVFSAMVDNFDSSLRQKAVELLGNTQDESFGKLLEKALQSRQFSQVNTSPTTSTNNTCTYCSLPFHTPVLNKDKLVELKCGHILHNICFRMNHNICNICSSINTK